MKTLKKLLEFKKPSPTVPYEEDSDTSLTPKAPDEKRFKDKHVVKKTEDANKNGDDVFRATNVKVYDRSASNHGYDADGDKKVYESKTLSAILSRDIHESESSSAAYDKHTAAANKMMDDISKAIVQHGKHVRTKSDYGSGEPQWHHADHMKGVHRTLQDIHQSLLQTNDYTAPPKPMKMKEGYELFDVFAEDVQQDVQTVFESLSEENQQIMIEMIETGEYDAVVEIVREII
jgi:hypothetical protein